MSFFIYQAIDVSDRFSSSWDKLAVKLNEWIDSFVLHLPNFVLAIVILILFWFLSNFVGKISAKLLRRTLKQDSIQVISVRILKIIIIIFGIFIALMVMDLDTLIASVLGAAGVIGLAVGLALQGTLSNTFSGVILSFLPNLRIGDWVETNGYAGFVTDINLRCVVIKPADNNLVMIPNTKIIQEPFTNLSTLSRSRIMINCGVGYESDLEFVEKLVKETIENHFEQKGNEEVEFFYEEFGSSSINFLLRFWTSSVNSKDQYTAAHTAVKIIKKAFNENGVNIPFPIRTLDFDKNKFRSEVVKIKNVE